MFVFFYGKKKNLHLCASCCCYCRSNMCPENSTANNHDFQMHCFEDTTSCKACSMLLRSARLAHPLLLSVSLRSPSSHAGRLHFFLCRGIFFQGYRCTRCKMAAHKECLGRVPACGRNSGLLAPVIFTSTQWVEEMCPLTASVCFCLSSHCRLWHPQEGNTTPVCALYLTPC